MILEGDNKAWELLIRRYQALVYSVSARAGLSSMDVADCFQQTWVLLHRHRHNLKDPSRLSAWLVTTAKREAIRLRQKMGRESSEEIDETMWLSNAILPDEEMERLECQAQLEIALKDLDDRCRKLLETFFFAPTEKSYVEIAKSFGISANTLGPIRRRCLDRLRKILENNGYLEERKEEKDTL
jgi:RNA polymerase sigma factor (sigma-70 family)